MAKLNILMIKAKMIFIGALTVSLVLGRALRTFLYGPFHMVYIKQSNIGLELFTPDFLEPIKDTQHLKTGQLNSKKLIRVMLN